MRYLKLIVALLLCALSTTLIQAQSPQHIVYLPSVLVKKVWMIDPEALALQPEHMPFYQITAHYHISNEEAIARSADPEATRAAFEAQGRVNAFFRRFGPGSSFEHQVILYTSVVGASQGVDALIAGREPIFRYGPKSEPGIDRIYFFSTRDPPNAPYLQPVTYTYSTVFQIDNYVHTMEYVFTTSTRLSTRDFDRFREKVDYAVERQHMIAP